MKKPIVNIETPLELKRALAEVAKSNRIAEINEKDKKLRLAKLKVEQFDSVDILEEIVTLVNGEEMTLFSIRGDENSDGIAVKTSDLVDGLITRKQVCDHLMKLA